MGNKREPSIEASAYIPASVLHSNKLNSSQKVLWGIIFATVTENGVSYVSNEWLSQQRNVSISTVEKNLRELDQSGYLERNTIKEDEFGDALRRELIPIHHPAQITGTPEQRKPRKNKEKKKEPKKKRNKKETKETNATHERNTQTHSVTQEVFNFWKSLRKNRLPDARKPKLTEAREMAIQDRLDEGYSVEDLKQAIAGCFSNDWNVERGFTGITLICRNADKVEQYIQWYKQNVVGTEVASVDSEPTSPRGETIDIDDTLADIGEEIQQRRGN